jgi:hypothetical protein
MVAISSALLADAIESLNWEYMRASMSADVLLSRFGLVSQVPARRVPRGRGRRHDQKSSSGNSSL